MKRLLTATIFVAGATGAHAADLTPMANYTKAPVERAYDWTGFYVGANLGIGLGQDSATNLIPGTGAFTQFDIAKTGASGGGQFGYNYQSGNWLVGAEADIQGITAPQEGTANCALNCRFTDQYLSWFGTVRGRLGYTTGPVLSYVTGGLAYGDVKTGQTIVTNGVPGSISWDQVRGGWTLGGGVEAALGGNWTGKIEYLYIDLGNMSESFVLGGAARSFSSDVREQIFRIGANYRFGGRQEMFYAPMADWRGFYLGGNGGSAIARDKYVQAIAAPVSSEDSFSEQPRGLMGGVQAGYNWQAAKFVVGLEADFQGSTQKDSWTCFFNCFLQDTQTMPWLGTVRARLGYDVGRTLFYATGGLAYGKVNTTITESLGPQTSVTTLNHAQVGWTAGGGIEAPFAFLGLFGNNWTVKTEYLYVDLGSTADAYTTAMFSPTPPFPVLPAVGHTYSTELREHIFRTGLNYHFDAPVVARY